MALDHKGSGETPDLEYPFVLITGRIREHYNNGSMTGRVPGIMELVPEELLELNAQDAETLRIKDGERVRVASRRGEITVQAKVTERSQAGNVFLTFHFRNTLTNVLTSGYRDPITGTPEYKSCAVKIDKI
ncbi:MAG TPA: molybdopterin dinucleotide binding domain-containing protein [Nitrospirota bacterium]|nr:molybdopterin dinucleotide binding domain-containing protein [Nitrospirota bacterium]